MYMSIFVNSFGSSQLPKTSLSEGTEKALYLDTQAKNLCLPHDRTLEHHLWTILPFCCGAEGGMVQGGVGVIYLGKFLQLYDLKKTMLHNIQFGGNKGI